MKFKLSINAIILTVILFFLAIFYIKGRQNSTLGQRKQEISQIAVSTEENVREIKITAKQFSFSPDIITLKLNEKVRFHISSEDVTHGFSLPEFNIDEVIQPGKETVIDFHASRKGTFNLICSVTCGTGHSGMRGTIVIE